MFLNKRFADNNLKKKEEKSGMITPEAMAYVTEQLKNGYTKAEIKAALLSQGWTDEDVEDAFPHE